MKREKRWRNKSRFLKILLAGVGELVLRVKQVVAVDDAAVSYLNGDTHCRLTRRRRRST